MEQIKRIKISVLTIFPGMFDIIRNYGVIKKAIEKKLVEIDILNLRDYTTDKHKVTDKPGYGGENGMVMLAEPFYRFYDEYILSKNHKPYVVLPSPQGEVFNNDLAFELAKKEELVFFCGRYEGIDERVRKIVDKEVSIGDYVLTGGEIPTMVIIETLLRFLPGVIGSKTSVENDSFYNGLLDYSHYTKPQNFRGMQVPEILLSGDHERIRIFRKKRQFVKNDIEEARSIYKERIR
nr:tRNA (guanosine(37)-N1)-methyltransferase TrmD [Petrotoga sp. 8T1HF07.NaAc.6.1]